MFILDDYLNNSNVDISHVEDVEMTNEGYTINGGVESVLLESYEASHKMNMLQIGMESKGVMMLHEASKNGESQEEALSKVNLLMEKVNFGILGKIKDLVMKMWAKMKEIVNSLKMALAKAFNESKYIQMATAALADLSDFTGFEYEGYNYNLNYDLYDKWIHAFNKAARGFDELQYSDYDDTIEQINIAIDKLKNSDSMDEYCKAGYGCNVSELEKTVFKELHGGDTKTTMKTINKDAALKILKEFKSSKYALDGMVKNINSFHTEIITMIDGYINEYKKKANDKDEHYANVSRTRSIIYTAKVSTLKDILGIANRVTGYKMAALKEEKVQAKAMVSKAIAVGKKNKKKDAGKLNASTEFFLDESYLYEDSDESFTNSNSYSSGSNFIDGLLSNI